MPIIRLETNISATPEVVFDLARSVDLHKLSAGKTNEEAIAGRLTGLMELNEEVTWRARHFGIYQKLSSRMVTLEKPYRFVDVMTKGIFKRFNHEHIFKTDGEHNTIMTDIFDYTTPMGALGRIADELFLERYMTHFLKERNAVIKMYAEM